MKRAISVLLLALLAGALAPAPASGDEPAVGVISYPSPLSKRERGLTERLNPCGEPHAALGDLNGLDGYWIELPILATGRAATLDASAVDADVWFYSLDATGCRLIGGAAGTAMATAMTGVESGVVPEGARYALVSLVVGHNATFVFSLA